MPSPGPSISLPPSGFRTLWGAVILVGVLAISLNVQFSAKTEFLWWLVLIVGVIAVGVGVYGLANPVLNGRKHPGKGGKTY